MAVTLTMTWAGGLASNVSGGFVLTDDLGNARPWSFASTEINNIPDPVARAVAEELQNQAGSSTGTVTVTIA